MKISITYLKSWDHKCFRFLDFGIGALPLLIEYPEHENLKCEMVQNLYS